MKASHSKKILSETFSESVSFCPTLSYIFYFSQIFLAASKQFVLPCMMSLQQNLPKRWYPGDAEVNASEAGQIDQGQMDNQRQRYVGGYGRGESQSGGGATPLGATLSGSIDGEMLLINSTLTSNDEVVPSNLSPPVSKVGIYGWRKRCLYLLILFILIVTIVNLALTVWIVKILDFNTNGMGRIRVKSNGLEVNGVAEFLHPIHTSKISGGNQMPLVLESVQNLTLQTVDSRNTGSVCNRVTLNEDQTEITTDDFWVKSCSGKTLLRAQKEKDLELGGNHVQVVSEGGTTFSGGVQSKTIKALSHQSLDIISRTNNIKLSGGQGIFLLSKSGGINIQTLDDIILTSKNGKIRLDADIKFDNLPIVETDDSIKDIQEEAFQLCICPNGRLFLVKADEKCKPIKKICS
jgi:hypothetical protein